MAEAKAAAQRQVAAQEALAAATNEQARHAAQAEQKRLTEESRLAQLASEKAAEMAAQANEPGLLQVTVIECSQLKSMDGRWGKNDVYAIVRVSPTVFQKTTTIDESGATPVWNNGEGEDLLFEIDAADTAGMVRVEIMDDDSDEKGKEDHTQDDFIGAAELHFDNAPAGRKWKLDQLIDVVDEKGKLSGKCHLIVRWQPPGRS